MAITFPSDTKDTIDSIRSAIGREITFIMKIKADCPACDLDPVTGTSTNYLCPVCSGLGYLITLSGMNVLAHVTNAPVYNVNWVTGGQFFTGDCGVQIEYNVGNVTVLGLADYVVVDTIPYLIKNKTFRGVPAINRILIDLVQKD